MKTDPNPRGREWVGDGHTVEIPLLIPEHSRAATVAGIGEKTIEDGDLPRRIHPEDRANAGAKAACPRGAIKVGVFVADQIHGGIRAVILQPARETVKHSLVTAGIQFEDGAETIGAAKLGRAVEVALFVGVPSESRRLLSR